MCLRFVVIILILCLIFISLIALHILITYLSNLLIEGQSLEIINELSLYIINLLIQEKVTSQKTMSELKQLLGTSDHKSLTDLTKVRISVIVYFINTQ
jgi:hypothetical protein